MKKFELALENDRWLNTAEFVKFCIKYANSHIVINVINEGHCLSHCGVYEVLDQFNFSSVLIKTANKLESHPRYQIDNHAWNHWLLTTKNFNFNFDYSWNGKNIFGCFYGRPSAPRLGIAWYLAKYYRLQSLIMTKFNFDCEDQRNLVDIARLFTWHPEAVSGLNILAAGEFGSEHVYHRGQYNYNNPLAESYQNIFVDIVAEPVCAGNSFYPTEKIVRSILCRKPFIVMGSKYYMHYLKQLGFKTFDQWWDESYDCFDTNNRYYKILSIIDYLMFKQDQIANYYQQMQSVLEHNYNLLVHQQFGSQIQQIKDDYEHA
jgi:hypothetical protein